MSPKNDMNSCKDFLVLVLHNYITVASMKVIELDKIDDWPSCIQEEMWMEHKEKRTKEMDYILSQLVDKFLDIEYLHIPTDSHSTDDEDKVFMYTKQLFSIGILYLEFIDAVKEGDGERGLQCWFFLIIFHNSNRKNYAKKEVTLLHYYQYLLSPQQKEQLLYNRFINMSGLPRRNILCDLHIDHEVKNGIATLGAGKTEKAIIRLGRALGTISPVLYQYDKINSITDYETRHKQATQKRYA